MTQPLFFGPAQRSLFGVLHDAPTARRGALLACAPLLQEGIRSQRALWSLAEALAAEGVETLRFDWFGSGDSGGDSEDMAYAGLLDDLGVACARLRLAAPRRTRILALRSAALPVLSRAVAGNAPVDLVLWDPQLCGSELVADWRRQHLQQLGEVGRYRRRAPSGSDELLGFVVDPALLDALAAVDAGATPLPSGSRVLLAAWDMTPQLQRFLAAQGPRVDVEQLLFDTPDRPSWDDGQRFEDLALPRRSVAQLAQRLGSAAW